MKEHPDYKYRPRRKPKTLSKQTASSAQDVLPSHKSLQLAKTHQATLPHQLTFQGSMEHNRLVDNCLHLGTTGSSNSESTPKYNFNTPLELTLSVPLRPSNGFPATMPHYPLDPTIALDLQARLHAMYAGSLYHPWHYFGCTPLVSPDTPPSPPKSNGILSTAFGCLGHSTNITSPPFTPFHQVPPSNII